MDPAEYHKIADPLSEVTRAERKWVLVSSAALFALSWGGLIPGKIDTLGIEVAQPNPRLLVILALAVTLYFLAAFIFYFRADRYVAENRLLRFERAQIDPVMESIVGNEEGKFERGGQLEDKLEEIIQGDIRWHIRIRYGFEFWSAVSFGLVSIALGIVWLSVS